MYAYAYMLCCVIVLLLARAGGMAESLNAARQASIRYQRLAVESSMKQLQYKFYNKELLQIRPDHSSRVYLH
eukprot:151470-Karenia_brevis.AAC.1